MIVSGNVPAWIQPRHVGLMSAARSGDASMSGTFGVRTGALVDRDGRIGLVGSDGTGEVLGDILGLMSRSWGKRRAVRITACCEPQAAEG